MIPFHGVDEKDYLEITVKNTAALHNRLQNVKERVVTIHITEDITTNLFLDESLGCSLSELWICGFPHAMGLQLGGNLCKKDLCSPEGEAYEHSGMILRQMLSFVKDDERGANSHDTNRPVLYVSQMDSLQSLYLDDVNPRLRCFLPGLFISYW